MALQFYTLWRCDVIQWQEKQQSQHHDTKKISTYFYVILLENQTFLNGKALLWVQWQRQTRYLMQLNIKCGAPLVAQWWRFPCNADVGLIPGLGRSSRERNGNPFQYFCLGNPMDRGDWWTIVYGVAKRVGHDLVTKQHHHHKMHYFTNSPVSYYLLVHVQKLSYPLWGPNNLIWSELVTTIKGDSYAS